jgi:hypothetical protein
MPSSLNTQGLRQHYRPSRFRTPGWLRQLWVWL